MGYRRPLAPATSLKQLVRTAKLRWRIERDFQELKQELGLNHFEGRSWRGFHHHATLCIAAYGFLVAERCAFPPLAIAAVKAPTRRATLSPAVPRIQPQRHEPASIASLRIILARLLLRSLPHCPYCHRLPASPGAPFL